MGHFSYSVSFLITYFFTAKMISNIICEYIRITRYISVEVMILVSDKDGLHVYNGSGDFIKTIRPKCGGTIYGVGIC